MPALKQALKLAGKAAPSVSKLAKNYTSKVSDKTQNAASKATDVVSDYGHKAADYGGKAVEKVKDTFSSSKPSKKSKPAPEPKKSTSLFGISLTKATLMVVGSAVVALLFAPKSGKETREDLKNRANELKDKGMDEAKVMMDDVKETYSEVKSKREDDNPLTNQTFSTDQSEVASVVPPSDPHAVPAAPVAPADPMVTDEYDSHTPYDETETLAVPVEEALEDTLDSKEDQDDADAELETNTGSQTLRVRPDEE